MLLKRQMMQKIGPIMQKIIAQGHGLHTRGSLINVSVHSNRVSVQPLGVTALTHEHDSGASRSELAASLPLVPEGHLGLTENKNADFMDLVGFLLS